jgi:hypothetical protein
LKPSWRSIVLPKKYLTRLSSRDHFVYFNPDRPILGPTFLSIKLEEIGLSTKLRLIQGGYQYGEEWDWFYNAVKNAWPKVLLDLKSFLEKEKL